MNFFIILAIIGADLFLIEEFVKFVGYAIKFGQKYNKYKNAYELQKDYDEKPSMGFKTKEQEKKEAEMRLSNRTRS